MKKKRNFIFKICSALLLCFTFIISFACNTYAWYVNDNGNLVSENLFNINDVYLNNGVQYVIQNDSLIVLTNSGSSQWNNLNYQIELSPNTIYTFSCNQTEMTYVYIVEILQDDTQISIRGNGQILEQNIICTFTSNVNTKKLAIAFYDSQHITNRISNIMLNEGNQVKPWEPYGIWYSETNYDNYYDTGYGVGYNAGINHAYSQLGSTIISPLVSGSSIAKFDTNNENFISRTNINDVYVSGDYYFLNWSADSDYWYHITLGWNDYYIIKDVGFTPGNFSSVIVTVNGIDFSNISYNGTFYGIFNIQDVTMTPVNQITISVKMNTSTFSGVNLYVSSFNNGIEDVQESFNNGYEQGIKTGKDSGYKLGYEDGYAEGSNPENTGRKLIWTIASTPFESFKTIWNVNVLGLNISGIILGLLMALLVIYLIKKIWK